MRVILTDFRYAWRMAKRSPGATLAIIAMLALGTGGVTAVFNPVYSLLFAPLPFPQPDQLVMTGGNIQMYNDRLRRFEPEDELGLIFSNLALYAPHSSDRVTIRDTGNRINAVSINVSVDFFKTLGVQPLRGSDFNRETGGGVIVSSRFWRNELMGADDAVGKIIQIISPLRVVGIMPESFDFPAGTDIWVYDDSRPVMMSSAIRYFGRLRPGISIGHASETLRSMDLRTLPTAPGGPLLQSLQTFLSGDKRPILWMLASAAVLFLLLVCAGVMNLLVALGARRRSEMAMRLIFGASRRNLVFQLLRETLPLVVAGALAGLWISEIAGVWLMTRFPELKGGDVVVPVRMAFFAAMVFGVTIIGGLTPALYASGVNLNTYLKSGADIKRRLLPFSMREYLTGLQLSLSLALLTGVGLLISNMMFHVDIPIRWSSRDIVVINNVSTQRATAKNAGSFQDATDIFAERARFLQDFLHRLKTMPEAASVGMIGSIPYSSAQARNGQMPLLVFKRPDDPINSAIPAIRGTASPETFDMLGITLLAGRHFSSFDTSTEFEVDFLLGGHGGPGGVAIINQELARRLWPEENPIGKTIYDGSYGAREVVGVVRDYYQGGGVNKDTSPAYYYPPAQAGSFLVRLHSRSMMKDLRQRISGLDSGTIKFEMRPLDEIVSASTANVRLTLQLLGGFAVLGMIVSGFGVYATTSLMAAARNRETGIRMALGAQTWDIIWLALWRGMRAILLGLPFGLFLAWVLSRMLSGYLFQVKIDDPLAWIISCAALLGITIIAALIPAVRASRVNPMDVLRNG